MGLATRLRGAVVVVIAALVASTVLAVPSGAVVAGAPPLDWVHALTSDPGGALSVDRDSAGNAYTGGYYYKPGTSIGSIPLPDPTGSWAHDLVKQDATGNVVWAIGITSVDIAHPTFTTAGDGTTYVAGTATWPITFGAAVGAGRTLTVADYIPHGYVVAYAPDGSISWLADLSTPGHLSVRAAAVSPSGGLDVAGTYDAGVAFPVPPTGSVGSSGGFVAHLDTTGQAISAGLFDVGGRLLDVQLRTDAGGLLHLGLALQGTATFATTSAPLTVAARGYGIDTVLVTVDASARAITSAQPPFAPGDPALPRLSAMDVTVSGGTVIAWSNGSAVAWVGVWDAAGALQWTQAFKGAPWLSTVRADTTGAVFVLASAMNGAWSIGAEPDAATFTSAAIVAFDPLGTLSWIEPAATYANGLSVSGGRLTVAAIAWDGAVVGAGATASPVSPGVITAQFELTPTGFATNLALTVADAPPAIDSAGASTVTFTVRNTGSSAATAAHVAVTIGDGLALSAATPSVGVYGAGVWSLGDLSAGESATLVLDLLAPARNGCVIVDVVGRVTFAGQDLNALDDAATATIPLAAAQPVGGDPVWAVIDGDGGFDIAAAAAGAPGGSVVETGAYDGATVFGSGPSAVRLPARTGSQWASFVAERRDDGSIAWAIAAPASLQDVSVDPSGQVVVIGRAQAGTTFGVGAAARTFTADSDLVAAYGPDGAFRWVTPIDFAARRVAVTSGGTAHVAGNSTAGATVAQVSASGVVVTQRSWSNSFVAAIALDGAGEPVITGELYGPVAFGPTTLTPTANLTGFLAHLDASANPRWAVPVIGSFSSSMVVDPGTGDIVRTTYPLSSPPMLERYHADGAAASAAPLVGGWLTTGTTQAPALAIDRHGNALTAGGYVTPGAAVPVFGSGSGMLAAYGPDGAALYIREFAMDARAITFAANGDPIVVGTYNTGGRTTIGFGAGEATVCSLGGYQPGMTRFVDSPQPGDVHGTVSDAGGAPVPGVTVSLLATWPSWKVAATATTGPDGTFDLPRLSPGSYRLRYFDAEGRFERQWWSNLPTYRTGSDLVVTAGSSLGADATLTAIPPAAIEGHVTDAATGQPLATAAVQVFSTDGFVAAVRTDASGGYRLNGIAPGSYWVRAVDHAAAGCALWGHKSQWAPGVTVFGDATPVVVGTEPLTVSVALPCWR